MGETVKPARTGAAGVVAGAAFAGWSVGSYAVGGRGTWRPLNLVAHSLWRGAALDGRLHPAEAIVGLLVAVAMGTVLTAPYAIVLWQAEISPALVVVAGAAIYFNAAWVVGDYILWPRIDPVGAAGFSPGVAWLAHIVAGAAAGTVLAVSPHSLGRALRRGGRALASALPGGSHA